MKILLLEHPRRVSPERCNDIANTPLSSCLLSGYAAGMLTSKGHEVIVVEGHMDGLKYGEIARTVEDFRPDLLGVHVVYHWQRDDALYAFLAEMKSAGLAPYIVAYGFYPTIAYTDILQDCPAIDAVIVGEH
ncbi:MAG: cobalamin-dependent protein, partial [Bacillota bacterium]